MRCYCTLAFFFITIVSTAQRFGGNPPSVKWKQINTDTARIIFPQGLDSQAARVATLIHQQAAHPAATLGNHLDKINIVLQAQTIIPNAYVGLGPYRSEFYLTPSLNNFEQGTTPWADILAIHEYRHVQQFNNFKHGISKIFGVLFGEEGYAVATAAAIPNWFFEGDAVYNETIRSGQGRGRLNSFTNAYPSLWLSNKNYSWLKLRNGSFKDYVPNHYDLGYLLVNYGRYKYGAAVWEKVTRDASAYKGLFYPFQAAIKKYTHVDYKTFRSGAFEFYRSRMERSEATGATITPVNFKYVTNHSFPYRINNDSLLYLRDDYRHRSTFFIKDASGEHKQRVKDISIDNQFSYRNGKIVYASYTTDPRWSWKDYSIIQVLDIYTNQQKTLTHQSKYFTPDISPDGKQVAAVYIPVDAHAALHILDAATGEIKQVISSSDINLYTDPKFIDDQSLVSVVRLNNGKSCLAKIDLAGNSTTRLTDPSFNVIGYPCVNNDTIYFTAGYDGNDDIYSLPVAGGTPVKLTAGVMGKYFVNAYNGQLTWSLFTADGYVLKEAKNLQPTRVPITNEAASAFPVANPDSTNAVPVNAIGERQWLSTKYPKSTRLLNFHSYRPNYEDPIFSYSIYGENVLNTLQTELYYLRNQNERTNAVGFNAVYGALFPFLSAGAEYTFDRERRIGNKIRYWDQLDSRIGINVPLNYTSGTSFKQLNIGTNYFLRNEFNKGVLADSLGSSKSFSYLQHYITASHYRQQAVQHIYPRLGYSVSLSHRYAISSFSANQFNANGTIYLPGIASTHSLVLRGSFQQVDTLNRGNFSNRITFARGYLDPYFARMWTASGNYHFPIAYPDFGIASIVYLQRVRGNLFFDLSKVYSRNKLNTADQRSVGGEIYFDTKWWNQYEVGFGIRYSHLLDRDLSSRNRNNILEFVLPMSIIPR